RPTRRRSRCTAPSSTWSRCGACSSASDPWPTPAVGRPTRWCEGDWPTACAASTSSPSAAAPTRCSATSSPSSACRCRPPPAERTPPRPTRDRTPPEHERERPTMDFGLTEEQNDLVGLAEQILTDRGTLERLAEVEAG